MTSDQARAVTTPPEPDPFLEHPVTSWMLGRRGQWRALDRRHPWIQDTLVLVLIALFSVGQVITGGRDHDTEPSHPVAVRLIAAAVLLAPLWWRRRAPLAALAAVAVLLPVEWSLGIWIAAGVVVLPLLNSVAVRCSMRVLAVAAAVTAVELAFALFVLQPLAEHRLATFLLMLGTCTGAVAVGLAARTSRAVLAAQADRATWLETDREQQARLAAAAERTRVAREMHDLVGHHVSIMIGLADGGATLATNRQESTAEPLRLIAETGRQALDDLRRVLGVLRDETSDPDLSPQPGLADIERMLTGVRSAGLAVTYQTSGDLHDLGQGMQLAVFRIVQEALTNTLKHAGPGASAQVTVAATPASLRVRITDRGPSTPRRRPRSTAGHGIVGIRERAALYGGTVTAGPHGGGWLVDAEMKKDAS